MDIKRRSERRANIASRTSTYTRNHTTPRPIPEYKRPAAITPRATAAHRGHNSKELKHRLVMFVTISKKYIKAGVNQARTIWVHQNRKHQVAAIMTTVVVVGSLITLFSFSPDNKGTGDSSGDVLGGNTIKPPFKALVPQGSIAETVDGRVAYDTEKQVVSYQSKVASGATVTVSQQKSPESFKANPDSELKKLAEQFSANQTLQVGGVIAYLGTSAKGPQTVIYYSHDLLIFLFSTEKLSISDWEEYIASLEPENT